MYEYVYVYGSRHLCTYYITYGASMIFHSLRVFVSVLSTS